MKFSELIDQATALLQRKGRLRYRSLQREFDLDDETLTDLKDELIQGQEVAIDKDGKVLVWAGDSQATFPTSSVTPHDSQPPSTYTPQHIAERIRAEQAAMESRGSSDGERKTITALFAGFKGSTALIEGLDPEEARAIIDPALQLMMDAVHQYDGYVAQSLGDGIFALFGAPIAHEDHPQRALYAALRMQEEMQGYTRAKQGQVDEGITQIREGLIAWQATGAECFLSYLHALLAEAYGQDGQIKAGLTAVGEALAFVERTDERFYEAELYRLKGELTLEQFKVQSSKGKKKRKNVSRRP